MLRLSLDPAGQVLYALREPLPPTPNPYRLLPMPHPLGWIDPSRQKGMDGRWGLRLLDQAQRLGAADALLLWGDGSVAETAIASLALEWGDSLLLPPQAGRVEGLGERLLLPAWAEERHLRIVHRPFTLREAQTHPLWCVNAVRGVWRAELHLPASSTDSQT
jgi:branched-subunit amino acid aminotransferase/4-amino-4-deoxychorismate lyase